jgi:hypothetical protein
VGDLLHDAYGGGGQPNDPTPRDDEDSDAGSDIDRIRSWPSTLLAVPTLGRRRATAARHV